MSAIEKLREEIDYLLNDEPEQFDDDFLAPTQAVLDKLTAMMADAFPPEEEAPVDFSVSCLGTGDVRVYARNGIGVHVRREIHINISNSTSRGDYVFYLEKGKEFRDDIYGTFDLTLDVFRRMFFWVAGQVDLTPSDDGKHQ